MSRDVVAENLAVVGAHFEHEMANAIDRVLDLYTDDVVWEAPARGVTLQGKRAAGDNYHHALGSMAGANVTSLRRFATADRVVDDGILRFTLTGPGMRNAPVTVGSDVELRLLHIFEMRDRRIAKESVYEMWPTQPANGLSINDASPQPSEPTPERILQLGTSFWASKTLLSAVELGVFTELAGGPLAEPALAERLGLHRRGARDFFDALVALGMLARNGDVYANTAETDLLLDRRKPSYVGGLLEMANARLYPFWGSLTEALRTGQPQNEAKHGDSFFDVLYSDAARLREFLQAMTGVSLGAAKAIAGKFPWDRYRTVIDIGAAQGATPVQIALAHPHISGGGYDLPVVGPVFEEYVRSFGLSDRLRFHPGNFFTDPLPSADVLVMGHILHDWNLDEKKQLLAKAYATLPPGGALLVYEGLIDDDRRANAFGLLMSLNMLIETPGGFDYTGADCCGWMREVGFRETRVEHLIGPDSMVVGTK